MFPCVQSGLTSADILPLSSEDDARRNAERMQRLWDEEVAACKLVTTDTARPSLSRVVWRFGKTRFLVALCLVFFSMIFQFIGPVRKQIWDIKIFFKSRSRYPQYLLTIFLFACSPSS